MVSTETSIPSTGTLNKPNNKSAFYAQHIKDWQQSGLSQEEYCKSVNLSYPAFVYWRIKFLEQDKSSSTEKRHLKSKIVEGKNPVFTQIKIKEPVGCDMLSLAPDVPIYIYNDINDMRKSINGLVLLVVDVLKKDPQSKALYLFYNKNMDAETTGDH